MAAHGAGHSACQLHCARLIHIAQGPEHLQERRELQSLTALQASPTSHPALLFHLYALVVLGEQQQRLVRQ